MTVWMWSGLHVVEEMQLPIRCFSINVSLDSPHYSAAAVAVGSAGCLSETPNLKLIPDCISADISVSVMERPAVKCFSLKRRIDAEVGKGARCCFWEDFLLRREKICSKQTK